MLHRGKYSFEMAHDFTFELLTFILLTFKFYSIMNAFRNQVSLIGNLGRMPEVKTFEGGRKMARLTLVTNEVYKNNNGEIVKNATWHSLIAWGRSAEKAEKYLTKGKEVMVKGKLINRNYTDKDGNKKYVTEVEIDDFYMLGRNAEVVG
jgi:single-strand DNA-binding protein